MIPRPGNIGGENPSEFGLISRLAELCGTGSTNDASPVLTGIGDDAAVVSTKSGEILLTTDAMVDGVHFRSASKRWHDIGWKCAVSNLSDIAAMGGVPDHALITLGIPSGASTGTYTDLYRGMNEAFDKYGGKIVGGDVVSSPVMFVNMALTGHPIAGSNGKPSWLKRSTANVGDLICVTGPLGGSSGGLEVLLSGKDNPAEALLINKHYRPVPRIELGQKLVKFGVRCGMDISDGLVVDLKKLARSSNVSVSIDMPAIPIENGLLPLFGSEAIEHALNGGEDYELLFTASSVTVKKIQKELHGDISVIGHVIESNIPGGRVTIRDAGGFDHEPRRKGWDHLNG